MFACTQWEGSIQGAGPYRLLNAIMALTCGTVGGCSYRLQATVATAQQAAATRAVPADVAVLAATREAPVVLVAVVATRFPTLVATRFPKL